METKKSILKTVKDTCHDEVQNVLVRSVQSRMSLKMMFVLLIVMVAYFMAEAAQFQAPQTSRTKANFNLNWKYIQGDQSGAQTVTYADGAWATVNLPHNFQNVPVNGNQNYYRGIGWYRKHFKLNSVSSNRKITLYFCGAVSVASVYINGTALPVNYGGFHPFCFDITQYCNLGGTDNVVAVKLDNSSNTSVPPQNPVTDIDYNLYGGINKDVFLIVTDKLYVPEAIQSWSSGWTEQGGQFVTFPSVSTSSASVNVKTWVKNMTGADASCSLSTYIVDSSNTIVQSSGIRLSAASNAVTQFTQNFSVASPRLWAPWSPYMYTVYTVVYNGTTPVDIYSTRIGIRSITYNVTQGVYCNGTPFKILGLNRTNEWVFVGHATPNNQQKRDAATLREYGCNFVRCSHYPMADAFYNGCDSVGLLLWVEFPSWHCCNPPSTDATWIARCADEVRFMVRNGRNHPSVMLWGAGLNEGTKNAAFDTPQNALCLSEDSTRPTTAARQSYTYSTGNIYTFYGQNEFVPGVLPSANPDPTGTVGFLNSEHTGHTFESASIRSTCTEQNLLDQGTMHLAMVTDGRNRNFCAGSVGWCGFDYYTNRSVSATPYFKPHGVFDLMHIPKSAAYFYKSQSAGDNYDGSKHPMVKIANYYMSTSPVDRRVYSNCDSVRLYQNGVLVQTKKPDTAMPAVPTSHQGTLATNMNLAHPPFTFKNVAFAAGSLRADGFLGGVVVASDTARTPGTAKGLRLIADPPVIEANGADFSRIEVYIVDSVGTWIPSTTTTNSVSFSLGSGERR